MPASPLIKVMTDAARKAGRSLVRDFGEVEQLQVSVKGPANFVSAADHKAEEIVFQELSKVRPGYGFLMEERGEVRGDRVADNATPGGFQVARTAVHLLGERRRQDWKRDELRVRMIQTGAGGAAMILGDHHACEPRVAFQILQPGPPGPQDAPQVVCIEGVQRLIMERRLDDHFVSAEAVARLEQPVRSDVRAAFDSQHRMTIRHHAHRPSRYVGWPALPPGENLRTGIGFAPFAERAPRR